MVIKFEFILKLFVVCFIIISCSRTHYITPVSMIRPDTSFKVNDDEIKKAFETKPQLPMPINIALYTAGTSIQGLADSIRKIPGVANVFEISPGLVEGDSYYTKRLSRWYDTYSQPVTTNLKQLRYLAAQGKADLLIYCGTTHISKLKSNYFTWTYIFVVTMLFVPGQDYELTSNMDGFFIDVRNGFLYGTFNGSERSFKKYVLLNYEDDDSKDANTNQILSDFLSSVRNLLANKEFYK
ncbi:MAG: hypothetical protein HW421_239 [Ignavibacteria bacterium]|nr:hypothetical protein [Ignavibacteria bacterium]